MSFLEVTAQLANGFLTTLLIFGVTLVGAIPLGLLITLGSMSKIPPVKWIFKIFVWIIRGTPLMLQIILVFYGPGLMGLGVKFDRLLAVILAFIINYACYFSEIYRGGIESIPKGQYEAGQVLGMTKAQIFQGSAVSGHQENSSADGQRDNHACQGYVPGARYRGRGACKGCGDHRFPEVAHLAAVLRRGVLPAVYRHRYAPAELRREEAELLPGLSGGAKWHY